MTGHLDRSEVQPDEQDGLAGNDGLGDELRGVEGETLVDEVRRHARVARDLDVVAGGMAVGGADQTFECSRVRRGGADRGVCPPRLGQ